MAMSKVRLVEQLLREAGLQGVTTSQMLEAGCGSRFGARVQELRRAGLTIDVERVRDGCYRYTLRESVPPPAPAPAHPAVAPNGEREFEPPDRLFVPPARNAALEDAW